MFTGLVEDVGKVISLKRRSTGARLTIGCSIEGFEEGESIAVNGACQTVAEYGEGRFSCDILPETLRVTNLGDLVPGTPVNLERALRLGDRMGGHIVNGHVDGTGIVRTVSKNPAFIEITAGRDITDYIVPKGSVALDGISLTIGPAPQSDSFKVFVIPHTLEKTTLASIVPGRKVNIEIDTIAKYIYKFARG